MFETEPILIFEDIYFSHNPTLSIVVNTFKEDPNSNMINQLYNRSVVAMVTQFLIRIDFTIQMNLIGLISCDEKWSTLSGQKKKKKLD